MLIFNQNYSSEISSLTIKLSLYFTSIFDFNVYYFSLSLCYIFVNNINK